MTEPSTTAAIRFGQVAIDCDKADVIARFYAELLGRTVSEGASEYWASIAGSVEPSFPTLLFLKVPEDKVGKNRLHLDFFTTDVAAATARAVELGASHVGDFDEWGTTWTTLRDPEGNLFDIGAAHD